MNETSQGNSGSARLSDEQMRILAWGMLDREPKESDAYKLAKEVLLRFGRTVP